jgi:hypothetical protein
MGKDHRLKIIQVSGTSLDPIVTPHKLTETQISTSPPASAPLHRRRHLSTGVGTCREPAPPSTAKDCEADPRTLDFLPKIRDDEKPDLAVLTGDQINGDTAPDVQTRPPNRKGSLSGKIQNQVFEPTVRCHSVDFWHMMVQMEQFLGDGGTGKRQYTAEPKSY